MNLAQILTENSPFFNNKDDIEKWLDSHDITGYRINNDLSVDVDQDVSIAYDGNLTHLPVQFNTVKAHFSIKHTAITSLRGAPRKVYGEFECSYNKLTTLEFIPTWMENMICYENHFTTYKHVRNTVQSCVEVSLPQYPVPGTMYWILVPKIEVISILTMGGQFDAMNNIMDILNRHIHTKDILACQEELIDAGLGQWAKL